MKFITDYFNAEKFESLFFIGVGIIAIALGIYFWFIVKEPLYKGIAIPIILVALIQITVGTTVYLRSPKDILKVENMLENEHSKIQTEECQRNERQNGYAALFYCSLTRHLPANEFKKQLCF